MINVLVTGVGGGVGQGIIKSLKMIKDLEINIIAADMSPLATGIYASDKSYLVPAFTSNEYIKKLEEIFLVEKIDHYFPGLDLELEFCAKNKEYFKKNFNVNTIISNLNTVQIANNKYLTFEFLKKHGFFHPKTFLPTEIDLENITFPVIVKPAIGSRSVGVSIANNQLELTSRLNNEQGLIIQELIGTSDEEYTCTVVVVNKKVSDVMILKRVLRAGDTFIAEPIKSDTISKYVTSLALALEVNGSCNFQLRIDANGTPKVFEINSRFSGTTPFCSQLGLNPVEFYLKNYMNIEYNYSIDYDSVVLRHWSEVLVKKEKVEELNNMKNIIPSIKVTSQLF